MANNSAKKNEQSIKQLKLYLQGAVIGLIIWLLSFNTMFLLSQTISIWHYLLCLLISGLNYILYKQILKCWQLQLPPQAAQYYYDILALNALVSLVDPYTHFIWHAYWIILAFVAWQGLKWLWGYITPKYQVPEEEEEEGSGKKKEKKEKKEKIKYVKH